MKFTRLLVAALLALVCATMTACYDPEADYCQSLQDQQAELETQYLALDGTNQDDTQDQVMDKIRTINHNWEVTCSGQPWIG